ncbi:MAG TPA: NADH-quinone oxidoreductase subunit NuoF [Candidatus Omnitrophota bacterium]|nr:NADH-quinone oxidoreductase subunit NuoF [Candidatus Omnitrophota bacterium]HQL40705.1 NADH-quinone oxidoreductase subunit NuoF [Candidatus Omnitrophota bacterium]
MLTERITSLKELDRIKDAAVAEKARRSIYKEVLICTGGGCIASGALEIKKRLQEKIEKNGVVIDIVETGCLGPCAKGPVMVVNPGHVFYENVSLQDVDQIFEEHLFKGKVVERLLHRNYETNQAVQDIKDVDFFKRQTKVVLRHCGTIDPQNIVDYIRVDGYQALAKALTSLTADQIIDEVKRSGLRGRGGAGFSTGMKWDFARKALGDVKYVICNADEGDPGAFMNRSVLEGDPHSVIEGMMIAALAIGAKQGFVYVRAEYPLAVSRLMKAIEQARACGLLGDKILGTDFSFDLDIRMGSGAFVCGEETALMASLEGKRGEPRPRPPFPAIKGLWGKPSLLNNVETYVNVPVILLKGADWFASMGSEKSKGTKVFALAGAVNNTGLVEVPIGTSLGELIYDIGGGIKNGKEFKAAQIGGPSGGCIPKQHLNVPLDYDTLVELGAIMGSGGLIVMDDDSCIVDVARFFLEFVQDESCGKCVPCRVGSKRMLEILEKICRGEGEPADLKKLVELGEGIKDSALCGLGYTSANPVRSTLRHFPKEYEEHIRDKHCEAGVCPDLVRAPCQSACPAGVDVPGFVALTGEERYAEALKLHRERNPFAAVCARVCFHTCEDKCRRATLDTSVSIRGVKRFMVDQEIVVQIPEMHQNEKNATKKIAIIGAGPAGLSCAYFLARLGYRPKVFEKEMRPGGMLVQTIPAYRLPRETLAREIRMIEQLGVDIETGKALGRDFTIESLKKHGYEAIFVAVGAPESVRLGLDGEDAQGVVDALDFLRTYNIRGSVPVGKKVIVVGGGNAAIDASRSALRLGAQEVTVIYRRSQNEMPAYAEEVDEAVHEGVKILPLTHPIEIKKDKNGKVCGLKCIHMKLGDFDQTGRRRPTANTEDVFDIETDQVIVAIGQKMDAKKILDGSVVKLSEKSFIIADPVSGKTSAEGIFAGGDVATGPSSVVMAIASGERAAVGIDQYLTGEAHAFWRKQKETKVDFDPDADPVPYPREPLRLIDVARRKHNFDEVEQSWNEGVARRQAKRCLRCDYGKCVEQKGGQA